MNVNTSGRNLFLFVILTGFLLCSLFLSPQISSKSKQKTIEDIKALIPDSLSLDNKVVYVDFWASWCVPCRNSFPWMKEMLAKYNDSGLVIITINVDKNKADADKFIAEQSSQSIHIFDPNGDLAKAFELEVMPTSFVFNKSGDLEFKHEGFREKESSDMETKLRKLLHGETLTHE